MHDKYLVKVFYPYSIILRNDIERNISYFEYEILISLKTTSIYITRAVNSITLPYFKVFNRFIHFIIIFESIDNCRHFIYNIINVIIYLNILILKMRLNKYLYHTNMFFLM